MSAQAPGRGAHRGQGAFIVVERAMKREEVILRPMSSELSWLQAADRYPSLDIGAIRGTRYAKGWRDTEHSVLHAMIRKDLQPSRGKSWTAETRAACLASSRTNSATSLAAGYRPRTSRGFGVTSAASSDSRRPSRASAVASVRSGWTASSGSPRPAPLTLPWRHFGPLDTGVDAP